MCGARPVWWLTHSFAGWCARNSLTLSTGLSSAERYVNHTHVGKFSCERHEGAGKEGEKKETGVGGGLPPNDLDSLSLSLLSPPLWISSSLRFDSDPFWGSFFGPGSRATHSVYFKLDVQLWCGGAFQRLARDRPTKIVPCATRSIKILGVSPAFGPTSSPRFLRPASPLCAKFPTATLPCLPSPPVLVRR